MGDFSLLGGGGPLIESGWDSANINGVAVTASASTHTKGSYAELLSAVNNTFDSNFIVIHFVHTGSATRFLVDIAVGAAASEQVIISNLFATLAPDKVAHYCFPLLVPGGVRISARCQSSSSSAVVGVYINRAAPGMINSAPLKRVTTYGANTGTTGGVTAVTTTAGTYGSWAQIDASIANEMKGFAIGCGRHPSSFTNGKVGFDIAKGAAASEVAIVEGLPITMSASREEGYPQSYGFFPIKQPAGTRIATRAVSSVLGTDFDNDIIIYGMD